MGLRNFYFRAHVDGRAAPLQAGPKGTGSMRIDVFVDDGGSQLVATVSCRVVGPNMIVDVDKNHALDNRLDPPKTLGSSEHVPKNTALLALQRELTRDGSTLEEWALEILKGNLERGLRWSVPL